tara:strand:- start:130 stop:1062 length:933 start_codon:yes stop_codon:yes gene_type:complete
MRDQRSSHNKSARRFADQRDSIQAEYKVLKSKLDDGLKKVKEKKNEANSYRARRDTAQEQLRILFAKAKSGNVEKRKSKNLTIEFNKLNSTIAQLEKQIETTYNTLEKEKKILKQIKSHKIDIQDLEPLIDEKSKLDVDLSNTETAITELKMVGDESHKLMVDALKEARKISEELNSLFKERNFLKSEGDRFHNGFVDEKKKADEVHKEIIELMKKITEVKDKMKSLMKERKSWVSDHNKSVRNQLKAPHEDDSIADSLVEKLLKQGTIEFGGTLEKDSDGREQDKKHKVIQRKKAISTARGRRSTAKKE